MVTQDTEFDIAGITIGGDGRPSTIYLFLRSSLTTYPVTTRADRVESVYVPKITSEGADDLFGRNDPELEEVQRRVNAGTCQLMFMVRWTLYDWDAVGPHFWFTKALTPIHPEIDSHDFFAALGNFGDYEFANERSPARFIFPGITEGAQRRYYRREDGPNAPDLANPAPTAIASAGWTSGIPLGTYQLNAIDVLDTPGSVSVSGPFRVYHRRKDQTNDIVRIARAWHRYWRNLPANEQALDSRSIVRKHVEHAIGRAWADRPNNSDIDVIYAGERTARERNARDAEDWMLGNLEQWEDWGFANLVHEIATDGSKRTILSTELDDYTFCHVNRDGSIGDRLSNGADGILESTWDAYQDTHYVAAVNHDVDGLTVETLTIIVHQGTTETAQVTVTGGLAPHAFLLTQTESWASIDTETGEITVSPETTVAVQDYTLRVKVTDDLGTIANIDVTVTVRTAESE